MGAHFEAVHDLGVERPWAGSSGTDSKWAGPGSGNQMSVIAHEAPGQHADPGIGAVVVEQAQVGAAVGISEENLLAVGAPPADVPRLPGQDTALISQRRT